MCLVLTWIDITANTDKAIEAKNYYDRLGFHLKKNNNMNEFQQMYEEQICLSRPVNHEINSGLIEMVPKIHKYSKEKVGVSLRGGFQTNFW